MLLPDPTKHFWIKFKIYYQKEVIGRITNPAINLLLAGTVSANNLYWPETLQDPSMDLPGPFYDPY